MWYNILESILHKYNKGLVRMNNNTTTQEYKDKKNKYAKKYYKEHQKEIDEKRKSYKLAHPEKELERWRRHRINHKEKLKSYRKDYYEKNKEKIDAYNKAWRDSHKKEKHESYMTYRNNFLDMYGRSCSCCGETIVEFLTIEHIQGRNGQGRKRSPTTDYKEAFQSYQPDLYETLCMNCNHAKGRLGYCPHQKINRGIHEKT
jgi:hypothetical protein